jgi:transposase
VHSSRGLQEVAHPKPIGRAKVRVRTLAGQVAEPQRLRTAGKPPKLAFVAIARKLLTILNAVAREKTAWQN